MNNDNPNAHGVVGEWWSTADVLPQVNERVLVYDPGWYDDDKCRVALYRGRGKPFFDITDDGGWDGTDTVTHWARLKPPTVAEVSEQKDRLEWAFNGKRGDYLTERFKRMKEEQCE